MHVVYYCGKTGKSKANLAQAFEDAFQCHVYSHSGTDYVKSHNLCVTTFSKIASSRAMVQILLTTKHGDLVNVVTSSHLIEI